MKKSTIQDIANYANVSVGTIDRVLHNRGKVSSEKKKKIEEAIKHLNFNPNFLARTLALRKQFVICSLFPKSTPSNGYWSLPRQGFDRAATSYQDFGIVQSSHEFSLFDESSFLKSAEAILEMKPNGVVLAPLLQKESLWFIEQLEHNNIPYVFIDVNISNRNNLSYIGPDIKGSGMVAARLLNSVLNADDDILIVNMVKGLENSTQIKVVEHGFREFFTTTHNENNRKISSITVPTTDQNTVNQSLRKYYLKNPDTKAVFVTNSRAHIISKYHELNKLDIKVIGFDLVEGNIAEIKKGNIDFLISQRPVFQGEKAVQTLFDYFVYKKSPEKIKYTPLDIVIRENIDYYLNAEYTFITS